MNTQSKSKQVSEINEEQPIVKKRKKRRNLDKIDRFKIEVLMNRKVSVKEIAEELGCHRSTIYNELKRATYVHTNYDLSEEVRYNPEQAQKLHEFNQSAKGPGLKIDKDHKLAACIEELIAEKKYSPYAALCEIRRMQEAGEETFSVEIKSVNTIYSYIDKEVFATLRRTDLPQGKEKQKRKTVERIPKKPKTDTIDKRPEEIETRETFGHWEMDTVVGCRGSETSVLVLTERKTRFEIVEPLKHHTMDEVRKAVNRIEKEYGANFFRFFKTVTVDNGSEFSDWESIEKALYRKGKRWKLFYAHPYSSFERGSNENNNRLIRRHVPKGNSFDGLTRKDMKEIQDWINDYPRAIFDGRTSRELFDAEIALLEGS